MHLKGEICRGTFLREGLTRQSYFHHIKMLFAFFFLLDFTFILIMQKPCQENFGALAQIKAMAPSCSFHFLFHFCAPTEKVSVSRKNILDGAVKISNSGSHLFNSPWAIQEALLKHFCCMQTTLLVLRRKSIHTNVWAEDYQPFQETALRGRQINIL